MTTIVQSISSKIASFNEGYLTKSGVFFGTAILPGLYEMGAYFKWIDPKYVDSEQHLGFFHHDHYVGSICRGMVIAGMLIQFSKLVFKVEKSETLKTPLLETPSSAPIPEPEKVTPSFWDGKPVAILCGAVGVVGLALIALTYPAFTSVGSVLGITSVYFAAYGLIATAFINLVMNKLPIKDVQVWLPGALGVVIVTIARLITFSAIGH